MNWLSCQIFGISKQALDFVRDVRILHPRLPAENFEKSVIYSHPLWSLACIGIRDQFCFGELRSVARIFYPLLARKSSGIAQILHDFFFLPEYGHLKNYTARGSSPPPRTPMLACPEGSD